MKLNHKFCAALMAGAGILGFAAQSSADPINFASNGSFEDTVIFSPPSTASEVTSIKLTGRQAISCVTNCTDGSSNVYSFLPQSNFVAVGFYVAEYNNQHDSFFGGGPGASPDGGNSYAADGGYQIGTLWQAPGEQSGFPGAFNASRDVGFGNQAQNSTVMVMPSQTYSSWVEDTMDFTATSVNEVLSFMATSTNSYPPFLLLDGASLSAVPEPASVGLAAAGALGLLFIARKRRVKDQE